MKIYIDIVLLLNLFFDFTLLFAVNYLLKRRVKLYRLILGSIIGSLSTLFLFMTLTNMELFILKFIISILMLITTFDFKSLKYTIKNTIYLYIISIFLGGFLYLLNNQFAYKQQGLIFYHSGLSINIILILLLTPVIICLYIKQNKELKNNYNNYYNIDIYINNNIIHAHSYLDTGNKLKDPYTLKPVLLLYNNKNPVFNNLKPLLIPFNTIKDKGFINGYKVDKVYIEGIGIKRRVIVGIIDNKIGIDGVDAIISPSILEGIWDY